MKDIAFDLRFVQSQLQENVFPSLFVDQADIFKWRQIVNQIVILKDQRDMVLAVVARPFGLDVLSIKQAGKEILLELGLDETQIKRNVLQLSGGQQQRVAIARALVSEAPVILADEPTGNLDEQTAGDIIAILKKLAKERQKCVIVVTHSKEVAEASDVVLELSRRSLVEKSK